MLAYVTIGTANLKRGAKFYDALAAELGVSRVMDNDRFIAWGDESGAPGIGLTYPFDNQPASVGNGVMVALSAKNPAQVDRLYAIALANGGSDEGPPGSRTAPFYAAYFRDPDGNKLNAICMVPIGGEA